MLRLSSDPSTQAPIAHLLADEDPAVRFAAVEWVAEANLTRFRDQLSAGLATGATTRALFEAYLAALERLDGVHRTIKDEWSGEQYALSLVENPDTAPAVRARALRVLRSDHPGLTVALLSQLTDAADSSTRLEAVRSLRERSEPEAHGKIDQLVMNQSAPMDLRAEAIVGISADTPDRKKLLLDLATGDEPALRCEALRSLRAAELNAQERERLASSSQKEADQELLSRLLGAEIPPRPARTDTAGWSRLLPTNGNAAAGERIFFHPRGPACFRCHQVDGRGGTIGPELSLASKALSDARLLESLLVPGKEIAPQFTSWAVVRRDGTLFTGVMLSESPDGTRQYGTPDGKTVTVADADVAEVRPLAASIMPDNLCDQMTMGELADLRAYLRGER